MLVLLGQRLPRLPLLLLLLLVHDDWPSPSSGFSSKPRKPRNRPDVVHLFGLHHRRHHHRRRRCGSSVQERRAWTGRSTLGR
uniref:Putative secreted protein n=1 Tax=Anopheles triannulatus TaxID=58253 RepID=A0A2M4B2P9_9DIPT